jgi:hypothetical protein
VRECLSLFYWVHRIHDTDPGWKYYISYCVFLVFEVVFVYFIFPETSGRSLEELAFCTFILTYISPSESADFNISVRGQYTVDQILYLRSPSVCTCLLSTTLGLLTCI